MDAKHCMGCRDDFYNGNNEIGVSNCWSKQHAELVTKYQLHINTPMNQKSGYRKRRVPNCFHQQGYIFLEKIPDYAR